MADPVSLLGTLPALVSLPAVCLQAVQTIRGFRSSLVHAHSDVAQLQQELEAIGELTSRCLALPPAEIPGDELQLWMKVCSSLKARIESFTASIAKLKTRLEGPSIGGINTRARIRKYLSEQDIEGERKHISEQKATMTVLFNGLQYKKLSQLCAQMGTMQQSQESIRMGLDQMFDMLRQQQPLLASACSATSTSLITTTTNRGTIMRRRKRSKCEMVGSAQDLRNGLRPAIARIVVTNGQSLLLVDFWPYRLESEKQGKRASAGSSLPRPQIGKITAEEAAQRMVVLRDMGIISTKDVNPSGQGYYDYLIQSSWGVNGPGYRQFRMVELLAKGGFLSDGDKLLNSCLGWVGEGPHMLLLEQLLGWTDTLVEVGPEVFSAWPTPLDSNFYVIYRYCDCLYIEALAYLTSADPEFGGTTRLQAAVLSNDIESVKTLLAELPAAAVFAKNFFGQSALHLAICKPNMVELLIQSKFSEHIDEQDKYGITPLMYSAAYGDMDSATVLLRAGANPYRRDRLRHMNFWSYVMFCNDSDYIQAVIEFYIEKFEHDASKAISTCLCIRLLSSADELLDYTNDTLKFLLQHTNLPEDITIGGTPVLHLCEFAEEALILLQYWQGSMNAANERGYSPLMIFAHHAEPAPVFRIAISRGAKPNLADNHGMNALHHLGAARVRDSTESWVAWMNAVAVLLSNGVYINQGDICECACSNSGCTIIQAFFWNVRGMFFSKQDRLLSILWLVELFLILKRTQTRHSIEMAIENFRRFQIFEEWSMKHTCCDHHKWASSIFGSRPCIRFFRPREDLMFGIREERRDEWEHEAKEITEEQEELVQQLDNECAAYRNESSDDVQKEWTKILARHVVLLEHKFNELLEEKAKRPNSYFEEVNSLPEDIITDRPLEYIDRERDCFSHCSPVFDKYGSLTEVNCKLEHHLDNFLEGFQNLSMELEYIGGETNQNWSGQREMMLEGLLEEVRRLRKVPVEERNWDIDGGIF